MYSKFLSFALLTSGAAQFSVWEAVLCIVGSLATSQSFYTRCQQPAPLNQSCDNQKCLQTLLGVPQGQNQPCVRPLLYRESFWVVRRAFALMFESLTSNMMLTRYQDEDPMVWIKIDTPYASGLHSSQQLDGCYKSLIPSSFISSFHFLIHMGRLPSMI